jgi:hypothetical protein
VPRLAIAIGEDARFGLGEVELPIDARTGEALLRARRQQVLLYRPEPALNLFIATGRVATIEFSTEGAPHLCRISQLQDFPTPVVSDLEAALPRRQRHMIVSDERFVELLAQGLDTGSPLLGAEEVGARFDAGGADGAEIYRRVYAEVLHRWNYHCPFTGRAFEPVDGPHPDLEVVAIRARDAGGPLHVDNYLPMLPAVAAAWRAGHLTLGPDLAFWVDKQLIDPELDEQLRPIGRLLDPAVNGSAPDQRYLAFHRQHVFGQAR